MKKLPLVLTVQAAFGAVMAVLLVVGIVAYRSVLASFESAQWAQHTEEVLEHLENLAKRLNARRVHLLTGTNLCPSFPQSISVPINDVKQHHSSELALEVCAKFNRQIGHCDRLPFYVDHRKIGHLTRDEFRQKTCCLRQGDDNEVKDIGKLEVPSQCRTLPEASDRPLDNVVVIKADEGICYR